MSDEPFFIEKEQEVGRLYKNIGSLALSLIPRTVIYCKTKG